MESCTFLNGKPILEGEPLPDSREFDFDAYLLELERQCLPEAQTDTNETAVHAQDRSLSASTSPHHKPVTVDEFHAPLLPVNHQIAASSHPPPASTLSFPGEDYLNQLLQFVNSPQLPFVLDSTATLPSATISNLAVPLPLGTSFAAQEPAAINQPLALNSASYQFPLPAAQQPDFRLRAPTDTRHLFFEPGQLPTTPRATFQPGTAHSRTQCRSARSYPYSRSARPSDRYRNGSQAAAITQEWVYQQQQQRYQQQVQSYLGARHQQLQYRARTDAAQLTAVPPHLLSLDATVFQRSTPAASRASSLPPLSHATTATATPIPTPSSSRSRSRSHEAELPVNPQSVRGPAARRRMKRQLNQHIRRYDPYKKKLDSMAEIDEQIAARREIWLENGYKNADFSCIIEGCDEYSIDAQTWARHCQTHGPKRAKCDFCGKMYSRDCGRIRHLARGCPKAPS